MGYMFFEASAFNADIGEWNVTSVSGTEGMFGEAVAFNADISGWDVKKATNMNYMFNGAANFTHTLCPAPWVESKASQEDMFQGSAGCIALTVSCVSCR